MNNNIFNISVKNFGAISNANIDIAPLTIFTGANSSGKSFIAKLINAFNSVNTSNIRNDILKSFSDTPKYLDSKNKELFNKLSDEMDEYFKKNYNKNNNSFKIPINEFNILFEDSLLKYFSLIFEDQFKEHFEEDLDNLINFKKSFFEINVGENILSKQKGEKLKFYNSTIKLNNVYYTSNTDETILINITGTEKYIEINVKPYSSNQKFSDFNTIFLNIYCSIANRIIESMPKRKSYYIPAERSEIITDKKMLSRRVKNESEISKNQSDVLSNIINIDTSKKGYFYELGCEFDKAFSGISVDIEEKDFINNIIYKECESGDIIPSKILSTSIHEMTLFSLYLKYVLKPDDILIIEEPEAHLHPKNQRLLLQYIVRAMNNGLKIILTTHSEYISDQLNNFVRLSNIPLKKILELNYNENDVLDFNDLNIYNFKNVSNNSYCSEKIDINETGFFEENFSKIVDELYEETRTIINSSVS